MKACRKVAAWSCCNTPNLGIDSGRRRYLFYAEGVCPDVGRGEAGGENEGSNATDHGGESW